MSHQISEHVDSWNSIKSPHPGWTRVRIQINSSRELRWRSLSSSRNFCRNWHQAGDFAARLPGFHRAGPSTPLDKSATVLDCWRDYRIFTPNCQVLSCRAGSRKACACYSGECAARVYIAGEIIISGNNIIDQCVLAHQESIFAQWMMGIIIRKQYHWISEF